MRFGSVKVPGIGGGHWEEWDNSGCDKIPGSTNYQSGPITILPDELNNEEGDF